ncbi:hypothetical protein PAPHI01_1445 [Pancytospora philotis]|nr:hypothetical protein PAPHI01_1445 [Pancytospora philotis]
MFSLACLMGVAPYLLQTVRATSKRCRDEASSSAEDIPSKVPCAFYRVRSDIVVKTMGDLFTQLKEHSKAVVEPYDQCIALYKGQVAAALESYIEKCYIRDSNQRYTESDDADYEAACAGIAENWSRECLRNEYLKDSHKNAMKAVEAYDNLFECFRRMVDKLTESISGRYKDTGVEQFEKEIAGLVTDTNEGTIWQERFGWNEACVEKLSSTGPFTRESYSMFKNIAEELKMHIVDSESHLTMDIFFAVDDTNRNQRSALREAVTEELEHMTGLYYEEVKEKMGVCALDYFVFIEFIYSNQNALDVIKGATDVFDKQFQEKYPEDSAGPDAEQMHALVKEAADEFVDAGLESACGAY